MIDIPILMYHLVAPQPAPEFRKYTVTPGEFATQMRWLAVAGYAPVSLDALVSHRTGGERLPSRPVVITFDDGFQGCYDYALPILQARGFTANFFIVTGLAGNPSRWIVPIKGVEYPLMGWREIRDVRAAGLLCGSHTVSHPHLAHIAPEECRQELLRSRRQLEDELGSEVRHLAYPFGSCNETVRIIAAEIGYVSGCSTEIGRSSPGDDLLMLHRVPVNGGESLADFVCRLMTARRPREYFRIRARSALRSLRAHRTAV